MPADRADDVPTEAPAPAKTEAHYLRLLSLMDETLSIVDEQLRFTFTTGVLNGALGYESSTWHNLDALTLIHPDDVGTMVDLWTRLMAAPGSSVEGEARMRAADGSWVDVVGRGVNLFDDPLIGGAVLTTHNISAQRRAERLTAAQTEVLELVARNHDLPAALSAIGRMVETNGVAERSAIWLFNAGTVTHRVGWTDPGTEAWLLYESTHIADRPWLRSIDDGKLLVVDDVRAAAPPAARRAFEQLGITSVWVRTFLSPRRTRVLGALIMFHEQQREPDAHDLRLAEVAAALVGLSSEVSSVHEQLSFLAHHDSLTGLANRPSLYARIDRLRGERVDERVLLLCDLNGFKAVNDRHGHGAGDEVLTAVAERLREACPDAEMIARLGGDEFVVIAACADDPACEDLVRRVRDAVARPITLTTGVDVSVGTAVGAARGDAARSPEAWVHAADVAMYAVKATQRRRATDL